MSNILSNNHTNNNTASSSHKTCISNVNSQNTLCVSNIQSINTNSNNIKKRQAEETFIPFAFQQKTVNGTLGSCFATNN